MPKVTVIMPSLNVIKYIKPCMDSVIKQTLLDIEILAIDAGSDDGTLEVLQGYAKKDRRIRVIHSDRKSYGYQLNVGIALAQGEYVGIVETDDKIESDMFQALYECATKTGADYVKGCAQSFLEITSEIVVSNRIVCTMLASVLDRSINPQKYPELFVTDRFLWLGIYRNSFIKTIKLNETPGAAFQDIGFMFQVLSSADSAVYLDKDVYFYRQDNAAASAYDRRGFQYLVEEYGYVRQFLQGKGKKWYQAYYRKMLNQCMGRFQMMAASGVFWEETISDMENLRDNLKQAVKCGILVPDELDETTEKWLGLFLKDAEDIYRYFAEELQNQKEYVCNLLETVKNCKVIVFGCGAIGRFVHALLEKWHFGFPVAYCDNKAELWNTKVQGITVFAPKETINRYPDAIYVVTGRKSEKAMQQQLRQMGVEDSRICIFQERADMMLFRMSESVIGTDSLR